MTKIPDTYYAFQMEWQSCADKAQWLDRSYAPRSVANSEGSAIAIAAKLLEQSITIAESGVRVTCLGLQSKPGGEITGTARFTLTFEKLPIEL